MDDPKINVRGARSGDESAFLDMWKDFVGAIPGEPGNHAMGELNWARAMDPAHALQCIIASDGNKGPIGFALFLAFPFTWSRGDVCYLQDIYVSAQSRGRGAAHAMIVHLQRLGEEAGWFKIFWMTQRDNFAAQRLYEKVAKRMDYFRYDLDISEP